MAYEKDGKLYDEKTHELIRDQHPGEPNPPYVGQHSLNPEDDEERDYQESEHAKRKGVKTLPNNAGQETQSEFEVRTGVAGPQPKPVDPEPEEVHDDGQAEAEAKAQAEAQAAEAEAANAEEDSPQDIDSDDND